MTYTNIENKVVKVTADDGMWLYDGTGFHKEVYTSLDADLEADGWMEVTDEFKQQTEETNEYD